MQYLIFLGLIGVIIYMLYRSKKNKTKQQTSNRKNKDEVWKTIKSYLKSQNNYGIEIVDSYVAKKRNIDQIDENLPASKKNKKKWEIKVRRLLAKNGKKYEKDNREIYVVCFQTKNTKTNIYNKPEAIECEVIRSRVKGEQPKISINKSLDFNEEMQWISPIRTNELKKNIADAKAKQKIEDKKNKKLKKKKNGKK